MREVQHLYFGNLGKLLLEAILATLDKALSEQFAWRISSFEWPSCVQALTKTWDPRKKLGPSVTFEQFRQVAFASNFCLSGLVSTEVHALWTDLFFLIVVHLLPGGGTDCTVWSCFLSIELTVRSFVIYVVVLDSEMKAVFDLTKKVLANGQRLFASVFDRPSGHSLVELVRTTLPVLRAVSLGATGTLEHVHAVAKQGTSSRSADRCRDAMV